MSNNHVPLVITIGQGRQQTSMHARKADYPSASCDSTSICFFMLASRKYRDCSWVHSPPILLTCNKETHSRSTRTQGSSTLVHLSGHDGSHLDERAHKPIQRCTHKRCDNGIPNYQLPSEDTMSRGS